MNILNLSRKQWISYVICKSDCVLFSSSLSRSLHLREKVEILKCTKFLVKWVSKGLIYRLLRSKGLIHYHLDYENQNNELLQPRFWCKLTSILKNHTWFGLWARWMYVNFHQHVCQKLCHILTDKRCRLKHDFAFNSQQVLYRNWTALLNVFSVTKWRWDTQYYK